MTRQAHARFRWFRPLTALSAATAIGAAVMVGGRSVAQPGAPLVRGNAVGEWRHWGADQWSTRYSPLAQITAANFDSLKVQWEWKAGAFGKDEYYRTTPLYANGRLFTVASTRRVAASSEYSSVMKRRASRPNACALPGLAAKSRIAAVNRA